MTSSTGGARQARKLTMFHVAWMILIAISTAANVQFCLSLAGESPVEKGLWVALGLAIEIILATLPFTLRDQWRREDFSLTIPTAAMFSIAALASLYAGLSFASTVREESIASKQAVLAMKGEISDLKARPTVAELQPRLDVLLADRRLGGCETVRSNFGREKCGQVADLKTQIATAEKNQARLLELEKHVQSMHTWPGASASTVDSGSTYAVGLLGKLGVQATESDIRLFATTGLVFLIWLGVVFGGVIATPYAEPAKEPAAKEPKEPALREEIPAKEPAKEPPHVDQDPKGGTKAPAATSVVSIKRRPKTEARVLSTLQKEGQIEGSKSAVARAVKVSRNTLDNVLDRLAEAGEIVRVTDGPHIRVALPMAA